MSLKRLIVLCLLLGLQSVPAQSQTAQTAYPFWSADPRPRLMTGDCRVCPLLPQTKWYFAGEWLAISNEKADAAVNLPHWLADAPFIESPPPVWLGQPESIHNVKLESSEHQIR